MHTKIAASIAAATVGAFLLSGCSDTSTDSSMDGQSTETMSSSASAEFNDADVMFARMMYPHHAQAVEMAEMVQGRSDNPDVQALASAIAAAQQPEMDQLTSWLAEWDQPAPSGDMGTMGGMDHGSGTGMMTQQDMDILAGLTGAEFDRQWLTMMIAHHTGAIEMAQAEIANGSNQDAQQMARTIVDTQQQEIDTMQQLLG
ncbi:DUF305 domain-containing protein [Rhodococcus sp. 06-156-3C]|uniref:DUF305 domain-containing protein n=1 Tax=Nocardiaceae TaxID=85025 RepID=UPI000522FCFA|nr:MULTISPECIES: DUF305 domain-containing protein [Rhodococcus]OZD11023.1 DUF305 domain-containing protein [Rhodococcus sp. 06-156-4C]OZD14438.1 DUF305 domain-containing protein [Rhodococcus sp. 06-156-4a]OZD24772.1 DUF305 domain-containing protein [Rhodococcus sp. 06-156-3C]OZD27746.1 DUF305 domain-containing protein [Rhodococcus sp. 06-156-3b]OZD39727.1 DUF305 domain-containing protein [Rhodococcus sp. 06-156-3]